LNRSIASSANLSVSASAGILFPAARLDPAEWREVAVPLLASLHQTEKIVRQARNSEEQFATGSANAPQTRGKKTVHQIN
jgi:hypothetical protein